MIQHKQHFTYAEMIEVLAINGDHLIWLKSNGGRPAGAKAGTVDSDGYIRIIFKDKALAAHRIVWLLVHGQWPMQSLDHINRNKTDNRIENLRLASFSQNQANKLAYGQVPFKGVKLTGRGLFQAACKKKYIGCFKTAEEAARAYDEKAKLVFGEFALLNFPEAA